jgi:hypothetical protein
MNMQSHVQDTLDEFMRLLRDLQEVEPNRFFYKINESTTANEIFEAVLEFRYAANSKELRDTGDRRIHIMLDKISEQAEVLNAFFRIKLFPNSVSQKQSWKTTVSRDPSATYAFRDDDSLEIGLMESELHESTLHVKRVWSHVGSFGGCRANFKIKLDPIQVKEFKARSVEPGLVQRAIDSRNKPAKT